MIAAAALRHNAMTEDALAATQAAEAGSDAINTSGLGAIPGYAGPVPLKIYISRGIIDSVIALPNAETPDFFHKAADALLHKWDGLTVQQAADLHVDAVSGATFSSRAIIDNMQRGLKDSGLMNRDSAISGQRSKADDQWPKAIAGLIVALMAVIIPLLWKNRVYRIVQQLLNVAVLGFWCGICLSHSYLFSLFRGQWKAEGVSDISQWTLLLLVLVAFVWPLFGRKSHYCNYVCPFGSLQELGGRCVKYKISLSQRTIKALTFFRRALWAVLMLCLWTGVWFEWVDYEPFSAFIVQSASWAVIVIAAIFIALSLFIPRPYCRFVCPLGTLLRTGQATGTKKQG